MEAGSQLIDPFSAALPDFSVDWRFLLPVRPGCRMLVLSEGGGDFARYFAALEMTVIVWRIDAPERAAGKPHQDSDRPQDSVLFRLPDPPFLPGSFDMVAIPFGIPQRLLPEAGGISGFQRSLSRLLRPGGRLLMGFVNPRSLRRPRLAGQSVFLPGRLKAELEGAGLRVLSLYGVAPDLLKPAYILPLRERSFRFFLQHRFSGKPAGRLFGMLPGSMTSAFLSRFLPCYFVVASA